LANTFAVILGPKAAKGDDGMAKKFIDILGQGGASKDSGLLRTLKKKHEIKSKVQV